MILLISHRISQYAHFTYFSSMLNNQRLEIKKQKAFFRVETGNKQRD